MTQNICRIKRTIWWKLALQGLLLAAALMICVLDLAQTGITTAQTQAIEMDGCTSAATEPGVPLQQTFIAQAPRLTGMQIYLEVSAQTQAEFSILQNGAVVQSQVRQLPAGSGWLSLSWDVPLVQDGECILQLICEDVVQVRYASPEQELYPAAQPGGMLLAMQYKAPAFGLVHKLLWAVFFLLCSLYLWCGNRPVMKKLLRFFAAVFFLTLVYQFNILDTANNLFPVFQFDSENLVLRGMDAQYSQTSERLIPFGLIGDDLGAYVSQVGLQGYIFRGLSRIVMRFLPQATAKLLYQTLCSAAMALVVCGIIWLTAALYTKGMAACFFAVFALSPWVVNFARNLYWVEFTWFLPMLLGLFTVYFGRGRLFGWLGAAAAFGVILLKCLCGYEYISSIMLGMILFPAAEWIQCMAERNHAAAQKWFWQIFRMGCGALAGFATALCLHGLLRGSGDLIAGLRTIYEQDVLRRTWGGSADAFAAELDLSESLNVGVWQVVLRYLDFDVYYSTQVLLGLDGNCFVPVLLLGAGASVLLLQQERRIREFVLFWLGAAVPLSWFVLAKAHSYIHVHMNFVLWYMGFLPVCLYLIGRAAMWLLQKQGLKSISLQTEGGCHGIR